MKIAMIGQKGIATGAGGVEKHVEKIALGLVKNDYDVTVYYRNTYDNRNSYTHKGIVLKKIKTFNKKSLNAIVYTFKATISAVAEGFDIYHYHAIGPALFCFIPKMFKKKVVVTIHGLDWERGKWGKVAKAILKLGEKIAGRNADVVITVSDNLRDYFIEKYKKRNKNNTIFIPNGVDLDKAMEPNLIKQFNLEKDEYSLFLGRIVPEKGISYLVDAYKNLNTEKKLVIAGGSSFTDNYYCEIRKSAKDNKNIIFTGSVSGNLLKELYSNCAFYVLPSEIEGMPLSLLEALSYGKYCLVSDIKENAYVVDSDILGKTFRKSDVVDLQNKMNEIIEKKLYENGALERINIVKDQYNWNSVIERTINVYKCLESELHIVSSKYE